MSPETDRPTCDVRIRMFYTPHAQSDRYCVYLIEISGVLVPVDLNKRLGAASQPLQL